MGKIKSPTKEELDNLRTPLIYKGDSRVKLCTIHSFKGWEGRLLVIYISNASHAVVYTAITRSKRHTDGSYLTIVSSNDRYNQIQGLIN